MIGRQSVLVLGGASSGKSAHAESVLVDEPEVLYLATGRAPTGDDPEWDAKVQAHRARRPAGWTTLELTDPVTLPDALRAARVPVLWDSTGSWLTALLDAAGAWESAAGWRDQVDRAVDATASAWADGRVGRVAVAEEVGWGVVPATASGRLFQQELGTLNQRLAAASDVARLVVAGRTWDLTRPAGGREGQRP